MKNLAIIITSAAPIFITSAAPIITSAAPIIALSLYFKSCNAKRKLHDLVLENLLFKDLSQSIYSAKLNFS